MIDKVLKLKQTSCLQRFLLRNTCAAIPCVTDETFNAIRGLIAIGQAGVAAA